MAFDQTTRNRLARFVSDARTLLTEEFTRQLQNEYGLDPASGDVTPIDRLTALDDRQHETARILRETLDYYLAGNSKVDGKTNRDVLDRIVREQAFTVLNRLCALRMSEARGLVIESIAKGYQSKGFQLYARLAGSGLGETGEAYRLYLLSLMDEFSIDLPILFERFSSQGRLFPREPVLLRLLNFINDPEIESVWSDDETIGWIYQYFNSKEERQAMKAESSTPRSSRELAVRSQYFTPRYVVQFLTDNTLGRIWYEMTRGETDLKNICHHLIRFPGEVFLKEGEESPKLNDAEDNPSSNDLLIQPVYIPHRPRKDPREIKMLDPACGSMHFGLYAFDLFEQIYAEAWELEEHLGEDALQRLADLDSLHKTYPDQKAYLKDVPRLIIERNIHGVDIDPRAVQIAGLSLWLRAQKSWQTQGLRPAERPQIHKSNVVCAEPMPGDRQMLEEFLSTLRGDGLEALMRKAWNIPTDQKVRATPQMAEALAKLVRTVWNEMELAGEAGSLLRIEETLRDAISTARKESEEKSPLFRMLEYGVNETPKEQYLQLLSGEDQDFFNRAEELVLLAVRDYAEQAVNGKSFRRRLFAGDATEGFAFINLCRKHFDVVIMNPPYSETEGGFQKYLKDNYPTNWTNLYSAFINRSFRLSDQKIGFVCPDGFLSAYRMTNLRSDFIEKRQLEFFTSLGKDVFDEMGLATIAVVLNNGYSHLIPTYLDISESGIGQKTVIKKELVTKRTNYILTPEIIRSTSRKWSEESLSPTYGVVTKGNCTFDDFRFIRGWWEVFEQEIDIKWARWQKGGDYQPFFSSTPYVMSWDFDNHGIEIRSFGISKVGTDAQVIQSSKYWWLPGLVGPALNTTGAGFNIRVLPAGQIFSAKSTVIFPNSKSECFVLLSLINSRYLRWFLYQQGAGLSGNTGKVKNLPIIWPDAETLNILETKAQKAITAMYQLESIKETSPYFITCVRDVKSIIENYRNCIDEIDKTTEKLYGEVVEEKQVKTGLELSDSAIKEATDGIVETPYGNSLLSYMIGIAFGRWDIRFSMDSKLSLTKIDAFSPLPACPPGMLVGSDNLPAKPKRIASLEWLYARTNPLNDSEKVQDSLISDSDYPIRFPWNGILVDDSTNDLDIILSVRKILFQLYQTKVDEIEQAICNSLKIDSLRSQIRNFGGFFDYHLRQYSKSRRYAPIYWPLSTPTCSYTLWLYYHRLNDQTIYTCVNDFIDPKLKQVSEEAARLRLKKGRSTADEKELERLTDLEHELKDFREELLCVAKFWKPNLNDGVEITAAPLWKLFQHKVWQKRLKETWQKLEAGEYDWSHLAYSIWPERVREKCKNDKSLAIAHDLEELYVEPPASAKKKKAKKPEVDEEIEGWFNDD